jgi:hypothetical protein
MNTPCTDIASDNTLHLLLFYSILFHTLSVRKCDRQKQCLQKGKFQPITCHEGTEGVWRYSSTLSLTWALYGVGGWRHAWLALALEITRYPLYRRLVGPQSWYGRTWKISSHRHSIPGTVQTIASRYTDYAVPAHEQCLQCFKIGPPPPAPPLGTVSPRVLNRILKGLMALRQGYWYIGILVYWYIHCKACLA